MCPQGLQHDRDRDVCVESDDGVIGGAGKKNEYQQLTFNNLQYTVST